MNKDRPALHFREKNPYFNHLLISLIPLIIYGFYKNGILPYLNQDTSLLGLFKPLLFPIIGFLSGLVVDFLKKQKRKSEYLETKNALYGLIICMTLPINSSLIITTLLITTSLSIIEVIPIKISSLNISKSLFSILFILIFNVSFLNATENNHLVLYSISDIFFGRNIGSVCATSIFWLLISYFYLCFDFYYKKEIPIYIIITFILLSFISEVLMPTGNLLTNILNPSIFFASIFFASEIRYSPFMEKSRMLYGISIGILSFFATKYINAQEGIYLSITLISLFVPLLDKIAIKWEEKNEKFCRIPKNKK